MQFDEINWDDLPPMGMVGDVLAKFELDDIPGGVDALVKFDDSDLLDNGQWPDLVSVLEEILPSLPVELIPAIRMLLFRWLQNFRGTYQLADVIQLVGKHLRHCWISLSGSDDIDWINELRLAASVSERADDTEFQTFIQLFRNFSITLLHECGIQVDPALDKMCVELIGWLSGAWVSIDRPRKVAILAIPQVVSCLMPAVQRLRPKILCTSNCSEALLSTISRFLDAIYASALPELSESALHILWSNTDLFTFLLVSTHGTEQLTRWNRALQYYGKLLELTLSVPSTESISHASSALSTLRIVSQNLGSASELLPLPLLSQFCALSERSTVAEVSIRIMNDVLLACLDIEAMTGSRCSMNWERLTVPLQHPTNVHRENVATHSSTLAAGCKLWVQLCLSYPSSTGLHALRSWLNALLQIASVEYSQTSHYGEHLLSTVPQLETLLLRLWKQVIQPDANGRDVFDHAHVIEFLNSITCNYFTALTSIFASSIECDEGCADWTHHVLECVGVPFLIVLHSECGASGFDPDSQTLLWQALRIVLDRASRDPKLWETCFSYFKEQEKNASRWERRDLLWAVSGFVPTANVIISTQGNNSHNQQTADREYVCRLLGEFPGQQDDVMMATKEVRVSDVLRRQVRELLATRNRKSTLSSSGLPSSQDDLIRAVHALLSSLLSSSWRAQQETAEHSWFCVQVHITRILTLHSIIHQGEYVSASESVSVEALLRVLYTTIAVIDPSSDWESTASGMLQDVDRSELILRTCRQHRLI